MILTPRLALSVLGLTALGGLAVAVSPFVQAERTLKDNQIKKISAALTDWLSAVDAGESRDKAEVEFREELEKLNDKVLKGGDLLALPADLGQVLYNANDYERKERDIKKMIGKVSADTYERGGRTIEFAIWTPDSYRAKQGPYPFILTIPAEGENPEEHLIKHWMNTELAKTTIIACPKMPGKSDEWVQPGGGVANSFLTMAAALRKWAIDVERVFVGGRGLGGEIAIELANMFPRQFAGAFAWAADAGGTIEPLNLQHVPVLITGGGSRAEAFQKRAKDAKVESVTLDPNGDAAAIGEWMADKTRANYPESVTVVPGAMFPTTGYWLSFGRVPEGSGARVDGTYDRETNTITLKSKGITEVTVYLSDAMFDLSKPVKVITNGVEAVDNFERSMNQFLGNVENSRTDPGRIFVTSRVYTMPLVEESDG